MLKSKINKLALPVLLIAIFTLLYIDYKCIFIPNLNRNQFIKELRLNHAYDLIISTNLSFEEISLLIGYNSFSHFATSFKSRYGLTPSALRKNNNNLL